MVNADLATWELIALGAIALILLLVLFPGVKRMTQESREAEKDWPGFLLPIGAVILLAIVLILIV